MKKISSVVMSVLMLSSVAVAGCNKKDNNASEYKISIACQSEESEQLVLDELIAEYESKNPGVVVELQTFSGKAFGEFMTSVSMDKENSPNIIWTSDSVHADWNEYFLDLRPFYERDASTDYALYYESMLDTAALNGHFKPTKNYKGSFRSNELDSSDGLDASNHSEYGLYFAPRDYNKPTILCNLALFAKLDEAYETTYKNKNGALPADYVSTTTRLDGITKGENWDDMQDLFDFSQMTAERLQYILNNASLAVQGDWKYIAVLDLKLGWEPCYTTVLNGLGVENILNSDATLNLSGIQTQLQALHDELYAVDSLYYSDLDDLQFKKGRTMMRAESRPVMLGYNNALSSQFSDYVKANNHSPLQAISIPTAKIAAGCSGYAINRVWHGKGVTVNGNYKSYDDLSWDFIKFIITKEGQEIAGASGHNVPILKSLYNAEANGGVTPAWRSVEGFSHMNHDAWVAGQELKQDWFDVYTPESRVGFRTTIETFFKSFSTENYKVGSLAALIAETNDNYNAVGPIANRR